MTKLDVSSLGTEGCYAMDLDVAQVMTLLRNLDGVMGNSANGVYCIKAVTLRDMLRVPILFETEHYFIAVADPKYVLLKVECNRWAMKRGQIVVDALLGAMQQGLNLPLSLFYVGRNQSLVFCSVARVVQLAPSCAPKAKFSTKAKALLFCVAVWAYYFGKYLL